MGRPKGFVMSPEQKTAMKAGREKARTAKLAAGEPLRVSKIRKGRKSKVEVRNGKPVIQITGKKRMPLISYGLIRDAFRSLRRHIEIDKILREDH